MCICLIVFYRDKKYTLIYGDIIMLKHTWLALDLCAGGVTSAEASSAHKPPSSSYAFASGKLSRAASSPSATNRSPRVASGKL